MISLIRILAILTVILFVSGCRVQELERQYDNLSQRYRVLENQKNQEINRLRSDLNNIRNELSSERSNLNNTELNNRDLIENIEVLETDLATYDNILNLVRNHQIDEALILAQSLKTSSGNELSLAIGDYLTGLNNLVLLQEAKVQLDQLTQQHWSNRFSAAKQILSFAMIGLAALISVGATGWMAIQQVRSISDKAQKAAAASMILLLIFLFLFFTPTNSTPISIFLVSSATGIDFTSSTQGGGFWAKLFMWIIPFGLGILISGYIRRILAEENNDKQMVLSSIAMTLACIFAIDTVSQLFWPQIPETIRYANTLFVVGAVVSFFINVLGRPSESDTGQAG